MIQTRFWRTGIVLLVIAAFVGCAGKWARKPKAGEAEEVVQYEEFGPTTTEQLPEPRIGESALVEEQTIAMDTDRGERIANEVYVTPESGELKTVYFDYDKYHLRPDALESLKSNALYLLDHDNVRVLVEGHCDDRGSQEYNLSLGEKRSKEVRDYLIEAGIHPDRVKIISYGEERPAAPNGTEQGWALNRRAEFKVAR